MDINTNNRRQNTVGHTRSLVLRTKGLDSLAQTFSLLTGCPLRCGELITEVLYDLLEVHYLSF